MVDYPGASSTALYKINNNGIITGSAQVSASRINFTVDLNGNFQQISFPPGYFSSLVKIYGINDQGVLSGWNPLPGYFFTLDPAGTVSIAGQAGSFYAPPASLNNSLQLLEISIASSFFVTHLFQPDHTEIPIIWDFPVPAPNSFASGLNNAGAIVGFESTYHGGGLPYVPFFRDPSGIFSEIVCPESPAPPFCLLR